MTKTPTTLNNGFGACFTDVTHADLHDEKFQHHAYKQWVEHRGLVAVRGEELASISPAQLVAWSQVFGRIDENRLAGRAACMVDDYPIVRIGNTKDSNGTLKAIFALVPALQNDDDVRYNPTTRRPVWHTDSTFKQEPPIGSVFHCKIAPPSGGETLFADTCSAYAALDETTQADLNALEAVCSLAHHDKKISLYSPGYGTLTPEQRIANPPRRVPVALTHPLSGQPAIYGLNSSTCAVVPKGETVSSERMDVFDLEGIEDESVLKLRDLLPQITGPEFTVRWRWQPGDIVVWDNRCTMHAAAGFDHERHEREMWRLTLLDA